VCAFLKTSFHHQAAATTELVGKLPFSFSLLMYKVERKNCRVHKLLQQTLIPKYIFLDRTRILTHVFVHPPSKKINCMTHLLLKCLSLNHSSGFCLNFDLFLPPCLPAFMSTSKECIITFPSSAKSIHKIVASHRQSKNC
jgi:hypothetical protein